MENGGQIAKFSKFFQIFGFHSGEPRKLFFGQIFKNLIISCPLKFLEPIFGHYKKVLTLGVITFLDLLPFPPMSLKFTVYTV